MIIRESLKNSVPNKLENPEEMGKFMNTYNLPKFKKEDIKYLNILMTRNNIEAVIRSFQIKRRRKK